MDAAGSDQTPCSNYLTADVGMKAGLEHWQALVAMKDPRDGVRTRLRRGLRWCALRLTTS